MEKRLNDLAFAYRQAIKNDNRVLAKIYLEHFKFLIGGAK